MMYTYAGFFRIKFDNARRFKIYIIVGSILIQYRGLKKYYIIHITLNFFSKLHKIKVQMPFGHVPKPKYFYYFDL